MKEYLSRRNLLFNMFSEFYCPDDCERIGCKHPDLHISISLLDIVSISIVSYKKVVEIFENYIKIGFDPLNEKQPFIGRISLELKKPCNFLDKKYCNIYPGRPIACALFPEACFLSEDFDNFSKKQVFKNFPCIQNPFNLSEERKKAILKLYEMLEKEIFLTDFYLFGVSPFMIDLKNLSEIILRKVSPLNDGKVKIVNHYVEEIISAKLIEGGYWFEWWNKMKRLDEVDGLDYLESLKKITDNILTKMDKNRLNIIHQFNEVKIQQIHIY